MLLSPCDTENDTVYDATVSHIPLCGDVVTVTQGPSTTHVGDRIWTTIRVGNIWVLTIKVRVSEG